MRTRRSTNSKAQSAKKVFARSVMYAACLSMIATLLIAIAASPGSRSRPLGRVRLASTSSGLIVKVGYVDTVNGGKSVTPNPWNGSSGVSYFNCGDGIGGNYSECALSTATLNEHGETFNVSTAGTNAMATLCVASRSCQGRKSSM